MSDYDLRFAHTQAEVKTLTRQPEQTDIALLDDVATRLEKAICALTEADIVRLCKKARFLVGGISDNDVMALFNEAVARTLERTRQWPPNLPFGAYIFGAMRSIAHGQRISAHAVNEISECDLAPTNQEGSEGYFASLHDPRGTDEALIEKAELATLEAHLDELKSHFAGDDNVELVLAALEDGTTRRVLVEEFGMSVTEYESARKKLRRGADVIFRGRRTK